LRQRDQKLLRVIDNWPGAEYLLVDANRYRPFPIIEAQVRPVGGVWPIEESNNDQLKHCWFDDTRINVHYLSKRLLSAVCGKKDMYLKPTKTEWTHPRQF